MKKWALLLVFILILVPAILFGEGIVIPDGDPLALALALIANYKTLGSLGIGAAIVDILIMIMKKYLGDFQYKLGVIAVLSVGYSIIVSLSQGLSLMNATILALVTYGGALMIYNGFRAPAAMLIAKLTGK